MARTRFVLQPKDYVGLQLTGFPLSDPWSSKGLRHVGTAEPVEELLRRVGLSPEAEIHICRVTPGGSAAELIEALDYCIERQVDVAMFDACVPEQAVLLSAKVDEAWQNGIACIAAADPGGGLCWPAALPNVLAVGAIGQLGTFPPDDTGTAALTPQLTPEGFFVPRFASAGPGVLAVDCCAPGVAVISGLPPASFRRQNRPAFRSPSLPAHGRSSARRGHVPQG